MKEIPDFRALVERHKDDPFAMIGINTDGDKATYRKLAAKHELNWRDAWQGSPGGPLPRLWGVNVYPTNYVLDAEGRIRHKGLHGNQLEAAVAKLLAEMSEADEG